MSNTKLDKSYIKNKIQKILDKEHRENSKKNIKELSEQFQFSCPICGDSQKNAHKKRGNLYYSNLFYVCYNCGEKMSFVKFCDTFNEQIDLEQRISMYKYIDENTIYKKSDDYILTELDKLIDIEDFMNYFNNRKNSWLYDIKPVQKNSHVYQYLKYERLIDDFSSILQGIYRVIKNGKTVYQTRVMISLNMAYAEDTKKILGIQLRNLEKDKNKRFYKIVEFEDIYNYMNPTDHLDEFEAISYNKLSHFYNILNIDFEKPITIFEGFLDSIFYKNAIGLIGVKSGDDILKFLTDSDADINLRFFYDNDETGIKKSTELLNKGYSVFLWNKLFQKLLEKNSKGKNKLKNIIDLNDLVISAKTPNIAEKLNLDKFFSIDEFDLMYLDKLIYSKTDNNWTINRKSLIF